MPTDAYLKLDGIDGESQDGVYEKHIEVLSWSWGATQPGTFHYGSGGSAGRVAMTDLSIVKYMDNSSNTIMGKCSSGKHIEKAELFLRKSGQGKNPKPFQIYTMQPVIISSYSTGGSGGEDQLTETLTLNFGKIEGEFKQQKKDGSFGGAVKFTVDMEKHEAE